jgi:NADH dehydrogenase
MILVTGGTGRVGQQVVKTLRQLNMPTRCLVRSGSEYYWLNETGCSYFFGDLRDEESVRRSCRDVESLVVCSGVRLETRENNHTTVTLEGHRTLFKAAADRGVKKVVMLSCMGVERDIPLPAFHARKLAEQALMDSGLDYTILRSSIHQHLFVELARQAKEKGEASLPGPGNNRLNPITTRDLAFMVVSALEHPGLSNQIIEVGGAEEMTALEAFQLACEVIETEPNGRPASPALARLGSNIGRPFRRFSNRFQEQAIWFNDDFIVDGPAIAEFFKLPQSDMRAAIAETNDVLTQLEDPELRKKRMVHPQFYATVYEPGEAQLSDLLDGPPPRRD